MSWMAIILTFALVDNVILSRLLGWRTARRLQVVGGRP